MGHAIEGVEGVYDRHEYNDEKAEVLRRLAARGRCYSQRTQRRRAADEAVAPSATTVSPSVSWSRSRDQGSQR